MDARKYKRELAELREKHLVLVKSLVVKTAQALSNLELKEVTLGEATNAVRLLNAIIGQTGASARREQVEDPLSGLRVVGTKRKRGTAG